MKPAIRYIKLFSLLAPALFFVHCSPTKSITSAPVQGTVVQEGFFTCFEKGLQLGGKPVWCEASAILFDGQKLMMANDKDMPGNNSSVFYRPFANRFADTVHPATYIINPLLKKATKFEDFALTPNRDYVFLTTAFDRAKPGSTEWDGFNSLCYWPIGQENKVRVVSRNHRDSTSISLRNSISKLLANDSFPKGMPYFKLEGLAIANKKMYWGIREEGKRFDDFTYKVKVISVSYEIDNGRAILDNDFEVLADMDLKILAPELPANMGLSSIEYDPVRNRFWILTSLEADGKLAAYLWMANFGDLRKSRMQLVRKADGSPLRFNNKAEDLCLLDNNTLLVIHDDDKVKTTVNGVVRNENQAAYSVVKLTTK
jgi:hypothetical protein